MKKIRGLKLVKENCIAGGAENKRDLFMRDVVVCPSRASTLQEFVAQFPECSYTVCRTIARLPCIYKFERHLQRLYESFLFLSQRTSRTATSYFSCGKTTKGIDTSVENHKLAENYGKQRRILAEPVVEVRKAADERRQTVKDTQNAQGKDIEQATQGAGEKRHFSDPATLEAVTEHHTLGPAPAFVESIAVTATNTRATTASGTEKVQDALPVRAHDETQQTAAQQQHTPADKFSPLVIRNLVNFPFLRQYRRKVQKPPKKQRQTQQQLREQLLQRSHRPPEERQQHFEQCRQHRAGIFQPTPPRVLQAAAVRLLTVLLKSAVASITVTTAPVSPTSADLAPAHVTTSTYTAAALEKLKAAETAAPAVSGQEGEGEIFKETSSIARTATVARPLHAEQQETRPSTGTFLKEAKAHIVVPGSTASASVEAAAVTTISQSAGGVALAPIIPNRFFRHTETTSAARGCTHTGTETTPAARLSTYKDTEITRAELGCAHTDTETTPEARESISQKEGVTDAGHDYASDVATLTGMVSARQQLQMLQHCIVKDQDNAQQQKRWQQQQHLQLLHTKQKQRDELSVILEPVKYDEERQKRWQHLGQEQSERKQKTPLQLRKQQPPLKQQAEQQEQTQTQGGQWEFISSRRIPDEKEEEEEERHVLLEQARQQQQQVHTHHHQQQHQCQYRAQEGRGTCKPHQSMCMSSPLKKHQKHAACQSGGDVPQKERRQNSGEMKLLPSMPQCDTATPGNHVCGKVTADTISYCRGSIPRRGVLLHRCSGDACAPIETQGNLLPCDFRFALVIKRLPHCTTTRTRLRARNLRFFNKSRSAPLPRLVSTGCNTISSTTSSSSGDSNSSSRERYTRIKRGKNHGRNDHSSMSSNTVVSRKDSSSDYHASSNSVSCSGTRCISSKTMKTRNRRRIISVLGRKRSSQNNTRKMRKSIKNIGTASCSSDSSNKCICRISHNRVCNSHEGIRSTLAFPSSPAALACTISTTPAATATIVEKRRQPITEGVAKTAVDVATKIRLTTDAAVSPSLASSSVSSAAAAPAASPAITQYPTSAGAGHAATAIAAVTSSAITSVGIIPPASCTHSGTPVQQKHALWGSIHMWLPFPLSSAPRTDGHRAAAAAHTTRNENRRERERGDAAGEGTREGESVTETKTSADTAAAAAAKDTAFHFLADPRGERDGINGLPARRNTHACVTQETQGELGEDGVGKRPVFVNRTQCIDSYKSVLAAAEQSRTTLCVEELDSGAATTEIVTLTNVKHHHRIRRISVSLLAFVERISPPLHEQLQGIGLSQQQEKEVEKERGSVSSYNFLKNENKQGIQHRDTPQYQHMQTQMQSEKEKHQLLLIEEGAQEQLKPMRMVEQQRQQVDIRANSDRGEEMMSSTYFAEVASRREKPMSTLWGVESDTSQKEASLASLPVPAAADDETTTGSVLSLTALAGTEAEAAQEVEAAVAATVSSGGSLGAGRQHMTALPNATRVTEKEKLKGCLVVALQHPCRQDPSVKNSSWIEERQQLLQQATLLAARVSKAKHDEQQHVEEVLLTTEDGRILEGLSSNFFAYDGTHREVVTADSSCCLCGTVRETVLLICREKGITVKLEPPQFFSGQTGQSPGKLPQAQQECERQSEQPFEQLERRQQSSEALKVLSYRYRHQQCQELSHQHSAHTPSQQHFQRQPEWTGAFLTSTTRLVLPIKRLLYFQKKSVAANNGNIREARAKMDSRTIDNVAALQYQQREGMKLHDEYLLHDYTFDCSSESVAAQMSTWVIGRALSEATWLSAPRERPRRITISLQTNRSKRTRRRGTRRHKHGHCCV